MKPEAVRRLVFVWLLAATVAAQADQFGDFEYSANATEVTITKYTGRGGDVTVPVTIAGLPVRSIGPSAFDGGASPDRVTIPDGVTTIERWGFGNCARLSSVRMPNSLTSLGDGAFYHCTGLTNMTLPERLVVIGQQVFDGCTSLTTVTLAEGITQVGIEMFIGCTNLISVTIPQGVIEIGYSAFQLCSALTDITIPDGVVSIGAGTFDRCSSLTSIMIPFGVTELGAGMFLDCTGLTSVMIPDSVTSMWGGTFEGCTSLTQLRIPRSVNVIGYWTFSGCTGLRALHFEGDCPAVVQGDGIGAFEGADSVVAYYLPDARGWASTLAGRPTALWRPQAESAGPDFGVVAGKFGFTVSWARDRSVVVEACADLDRPSWTAVGTNTLTGGSAYFSDPQWGDYPARFYRLRSAH